MARSREISPLVAEPRPRWPFAGTDPAPAGRPEVVPMDGVLVAVLADDAAGAHAYRALVHAGVDPDHLRLYWSVQIVVYAQQLAREGCGRDGDALTELADAGRRGCSALWALVPDDAELARVVRALADEQTLGARYHLDGRVETVSPG
jgi:hypothetical protein